MNAFPSPEFQTKFENWLAGCQKKINDYWTKMGYTYAPAPTLSFSINKRFIAVYRNDANTKSGSIYAFIDILGGMSMGAMNKPGDILKPATYRAPAKHARGNIFEDDGGLSGMSDYGPRYLK